MSPVWRLGCAAVACVGVLAGCRNETTGSTDARPAVIESSATAADVEGVIDDWLDRPGTGGVVAAVGLADGSVHAAAIGEGEPGHAAAVDEVMRVGSITKTYMAALTLRLADRGLFALDDPVTMHLPELDLPAAVTVGDLLAHTSGVSDPDPEDLIDRFRADPAHRFDTAELIALAGLPGADDRTPAEFAYANANYHLVGMVLEAVTGEDIAVVLRREVLDPASLDHTALAGFEPLGEQVVPGNADLDGDGALDSLVDVPYDAVETYTWTAGDLVATPSDLITFARALFDGDMVSDGARLRLTGTGGETLGVVDLDGAWGHNGGAPGYLAAFAHDPDRGVTAALFTNCPACVQHDTMWTVTGDLLEVAADAR